MTNPIIQALEITGIGMGLVFLGILILWGMMALLVWIFKDKRTSEHEEEIHEEDQPASKPDLKKSEPLLRLLLNNKESTAASCRFSRGSSTFAGIRCCSTITCHSHEFMADCQPHDPDQSAQSILHPQTTRKLI